MKIATGYGTTSTKMATGFFVEFRLHGYAKGYARWVIAHAHNKAKKLKVKAKSGVPHIALFGAAETDDIEQVISEIERIGQRYALVPFKINGFSRFNKPNKVIFLDVEPSAKLEQFRRELAGRLMPLCRKYTLWDTMQRYKFHSTILLNIIADNNKFDGLFNYVKDQCDLNSYRLYKISLWDRLLNLIRKYFQGIEEDDPYISQHLLRVTILVKGRIRGEYDLLLKKLLNRRKALSKYWWRKSISKFRELQGQY